MKTKLSLLLLTALPLLSSALEPMRTFTDVTGRTTQAALVSVSGDDVTLQLANGQEATLKLSRFSAADQQYIASKAKELSKEPTGNASLDSQALRKGLARRIVFPHVSFNNATWEEAAEFFRVKSRELDPEHKGITLLAQNTSKMTQPKISLDLVNISLAEALSFAAMQARLEITQVGDALMLTPSADVHPPFSASLPSERLQRQSSIIYPQVQFSGANLAEAVEFLRVKMKDLDPQHESVSLIIDPDLDSKAETISIDAKDVPLIEALKYVSALANAEAICIGDAYYFQPKK
jgi:hypothetical protein